MRIFHIYKFFLFILLFVIIVLVIYLKQIRDVNLNRKSWDLECPSDHKQLGLIGEIDINFEDNSESQVESLLYGQNIKYGGRWEPTSGCKSMHHVAILIPYRNRQEQLNKFLLNMHPIFARQKLSYGIYLIEPIGNMTFNRGLLFNIGFVESNKDSNDTWECHAYHDVDLLLEDDRTMYTCPHNPTHLSVRINKFNYNPLYVGTFGGATIMKKNDFIKSNGYSNKFFGWGAEDDDHKRRLVKSRLKIDKISEPYGRYFMLQHQQEKPNFQRTNLLETGLARYKFDGLNSLKYKLNKVIKTKLYTKFLVEYNELEIMNT